MNTNKSGKVRSVCFTVNNPAEDWSIQLTDKIKFAVWQKEKGEDGTVHMQGVIQFKNPQMFNTAKNMVDPRAHIEPTKNLQASINYCKKAESRIDGPWEIGDVPVGSGRRMDIAHVVESIKAGAKRKDIMLDPATMETVAKYPRFCYEVAGVIQEELVKPDFRLKDEQFFKWQKELFSRLEDEPDRRTVHWYWSYEGATGKSSTATHLWSTRDAFVMGIAKSAVVAYAYDNQSIVIFDLARVIKEELLDHIYSLCEDFKNGRIFSPKYESRVKYFKPPHVIVFSNQLPDMMKMSSDRWNIVNVQEERERELEEARTETSSTSFVQTAPRENQDDTPYGTHTLLNEEVQASGAANRIRQKYNKDCNFIV